MDNELGRHINRTRVAQAKRHSETRFTDLNIKLGPLTARLRDEAQWCAQEHLYPAWQVYADEIEMILEFANVQGQLNTYWPKLTARIPQRDSALDELRVACYLHDHGIRIIEWEPLGQGNKRGEFLVCGQSGMKVFVEVKGPRWEGELKEYEIQGGRTKQPKDLYLETRPIAPWKQIQLEVEKAYQKFSSSLPNLLVVVGHRGFISLEHGTDMHATQALYDAHHSGYFTDARYSKTGGVGIFWMGNDMSESWYEMRLYLNRYAFEPLPKDLLEAL
jgi:hypothetical protein